jgi:hypothetical protein
MQCPKCSSPNSADASFCQNCGAPLPKDSSAQVSTGDIVNTGAGGVRNIAVNFNITAQTAILLFVIVVLGSILLFQPRLNIPLVASPSSTATSTLTFTPSATARVSPISTTVVPTNTLAVSTPQGTLVSGKVVVVSAAPYWQDTQVLVAVGQEVQIRYLSGQWCGGAGSCYDGNGAWFQRIQIGVGLDVAWASLVAKIANGKALYVGNSVSFISGEAGRLYLRMNDDDGSSDNFGEIQVSVKIVVTR